MSGELQGIIGTVVGTLTVQEITWIQQKNRRCKAYKCLCICGNEVIIRQYDLTRPDIEKRPKSCGCLRKKKQKEQKINRKKHLIVLGQVFTNLTVCGPEVKINGRLKWQVSCSCGSNKVQYVSTNELVSGNTKSCGCLAREKTQEYFKRYRKNKGYPEITLLTSRTSLLRSILLKSGILSDVLKRDNYTCQLCGNVHGKSKLQVHHIIPINENPDLVYQLTNMISLCKICHFVKAHAKNNKHIDMNIAKILKEKLSLFYTETI